MMAGLISDLEGGCLDDADLSASEECLRRRLVAPDDTDWRLQDSEKRALMAVVNEHDRQLRETHLQTLVRATERFERLLKSVDTLKEMFGARREESGRQSKS